MRRSRQDEKKELEKVGRKGEGDRKIENRETKRESSHPHTVRGSFVLAFVSSNCQAGRQDRGAEG